jgi:hypothetical protein
LISVAQWSSEAITCPPASAVGYIFKIFRKENGAAISRTSAIRHWSLVIRHCF